MNEAICAHIGRDAFGSGPDWLIFMARAQFGHTGPGYMAVPKVVNIDRCILLTKNWAWFFFRLF